MGGVGCTSLLLAVMTFWCLKVFWSPSLLVVPQVFRGDLLTCTPLRCFLSRSNMWQVQKTVVENKHSGVRQSELPYSSFGLLGRGLHFSVTPDSSPVRGTSLVAQMVKNLPAMQEAWV